MSSDKCTTIVMSPGGISYDYTEGDKKFLVYDANLILDFIDKKYQIFPSDYIHITLDITSHDRIIFNGAMYKYDKLKKILNKRKLGNDETVAIIHKIHKYKNYKRTPENKVYGICNYHFYIRVVNNTNKKYVSLNDHVYS